MPGASGAGVAKGYMVGRNGDGGGRERISMFTIFPKMALVVLIYAAVALSVSMTSSDGAASFVGTIDRFQAGQCAGMTSAAPDAGPCYVGTLNSRS